MTIQGWILILAFTGILLALTKPVGVWLFALYEGRRTPLHVVLGPVERGFYKLAGSDQNAEQSWRRYAVHMLIFNAMLLYNRACYASLAGRRDNALADLRRSIELDASIVDMARGDSDFEPLAEDDEFAELVR